MKIIEKDQELFDLLSTFLNSNDINRFKNELINYILRVEMKDSQFSPNISNKAKKPSEKSLSVSDEEFDGSEEMSKSKQTKSRTKSEVIDFKRASFTDYYKLVKEDVYQTNSADSLDFNNNAAINEVKSYMEMSKTNEVIIITPRLDIFKQIF